MQRHQVNTRRRRAAHHPRSSWLDNITEAEIAEALNTMGLGPGMTFWQTSQEQEPAVR
jgi:hypothetical protein